MEEKLAFEGDPKDKLKQLKIELIVRNSDVTEARKQWEDVMLRHQDDVGVYDKQIIFVLILSLGLVLVQVCGL